jgi:hypothetical protein
VRRSGLVAVLATLLLAAAGCGGNGEAGSSLTTEPAAAPEDYPPDPAAERTLDRFIRAAGRNDAVATWRLLDTPSRQRYGPTARDWAAGTGKELNETLGALARPGGEYEPVLARRISDRWSVAAVRGVVSVLGEEQWGAYAAVVTREDGEERIALAGTVDVVPVLPEPELVSRSTPDITAEITGAEPILTKALWVDTEPFEARLSADEVILASEVSTPLEPGRHTVVVYADTQSGAGTGAWTFESG